MKKEPHEYGRHLWRVRLSDGRYIQFYADRLTIGDDGSLVARSERKADGDPEIVAAVGRGFWQLAYPAEPRLGTPLSVRFPDPSYPPTKPSTARKTLKQWDAKQ